MRGRGEAGGSCDKKKNDGENPQGSVYLAWQGVSHRLICAEAHPARLECIEAVGKPERR